MILYTKFRNLYKGLSGRKGFGSEGTLYPILEANAGGMFPLYGRYGSGARCTA